MIFNNPEYITIVVLSAIAVALILYLIFRSPFDYPYFVHQFDISGKRNPCIEDWIDEFIIDGNFYLIQLHNEKIKRWKNDCERKIDKSILKNYRNDQFQKCLDDKNAFCFMFVRMQTRYHQHNYVKTPYKVSQVVSEYSYDYTYLLSRNNLLKSIDYEMPLRKYYSKNQRKLMTKELREKVILRDNYTCRICGKYMPDGVGLQIDHIVPISKGGKTVLSNLQVTCSKCNGHKKDKLEY